MLGVMFREWCKGLELVRATLGIEAQEQATYRPLGEEMVGGDAVSPVGIHDALRRALDADEFELHYQPIVDLLSRQWLGAEALCRWRRSDGRLIPPKEFIPEAERSGLIAELGAWVIEQAARDQLDLRAQGLSEEFYFSVNVAVSQLVEWDTLERALGDAAARGVHLKLEITENAFASGVIGLGRRLETLRKSGSAIAVDDFGTGDSLLPRLQGLPVTSLKIDQGLLARARDLAGYELLAGIAAMARGFGFETVVEGIEQEAQVKLSLSLGLMTGQGFLFARPRAFDDFRAALRMVGGLPLRQPEAARLKA